MNIRGFDTVKIEPINILIYLLRFEGILTPLTGYFAGRVALKDSGLLWGAYIDGVPCGVAVGEVKNSGLIIFYISVAEEYRRMGVCKVIFTECFAYAETAGLRFVNLCFTQNESENGFIPDYLGKLGFMVRSSCTTVIVCVSDVFKSEWHIFLETYSRLSGLLSKKGYIAKNFAELEPEILETLYEMMGSKFSDTLDPRSRFNHMLERHSFVTIANGLPTAYSVITSADDGKTAIIEYMSAAKGFIGKGVFLPCLISSVESLLLGGECTKIAYTFNDGNDNMKKLIKSVFAFTDMSVHETLNFRKGGFRRETTHNK